MITTLALLYGPQAADTLPELRNLVAHASRIRDPKFKERFRRSHGETGLGNALSNRFREIPAPAAGG